MKKILLKKLFVAFLIFSFAAGVSAQYDVPANYASVKLAINAIKAAMGVKEATINDAESGYLEDMYNGHANKPMKITIQGAGAGKTLLKGYEGILIKPHFSVINN